MNTKAVILGCDYYIGLSTIRCLGMKGIHTVAVDYTKKYAYGAKSKYCSEKLIAPYYKEDPKGLVEFLKDYASRQSSPPVLFPCHDSYVALIDEYLEELKEYYLIPQTGAGLYTKLMNKRVLHRIATERGVAVPETVRTDEEDFLQKVETILKFPCIVKPIDSPPFLAKFRVKLFKVNNKKELLQAVEKANEAGFEVVVQRIVQGFDDHMYTFDAYLDQDSKVTHWATCQKYRQYPINFGASVYIGQKYIPELYEIGGKFLEGLKYKGFAEIEFKKDAKTGEFYLIEVNVRITNFNHLLYKVGLNIPYITYRELTGKPLEPKVIKEESNMVFWYAYEDLLAIKDYIRTGQLTLGRIFVSFLKKTKVYAIWNWKDPMPAFSCVVIFTGKVFKKIFKKVFGNRNQTKL